MLHCPQLVLLATRTQHTWPSHKPYMKPLCSHNPNLTYLWWCKTRANVIMYCTTCTNEPFKCFESERHYCTYSFCTLIDCQLYKMLVPPLQSTPCNHRHLLPPIHTGGFFRKVLYSGGLMTATASLCYPYQAVRIGKAEIEWVQTKAADLYKGATSSPAVSMDIDIHTWRRLFLEGIVLQVDSEPLIRKVLANLDRVWILFC